METRSLFYVLTIAYKAYYSSYALPLWGPHRNNY